MPLTAEQTASLQAGLKNISNVQSGAAPLPAGYQYIGGATPTATSPVGYQKIVSSSAPQVTADNALKTTVANAAAGLPEAAKPDNTQAISTSQAVLKQIDDQIAAMEARRSQEIAGINAGFDVARTNTEKAQTKETGATSVGIARMGGYLGGSGSGTGVMLNLAQSHRDEMVALEAKRQDAIRQANIAIDDKQFQLAQAKVAEAKSLEETIYSRNKDFWNQQLQLQQENRAQNTFLQDKYKNELDALVAVGGTPDPQKAAEIDNFYGVPGFTAEAIAIKEADTKAKSQKAQLDNFKAKVDLLKKIPKGMPITFGGETVTGIGDAGDISTFHVNNDETGETTLVTYNTMTGELTTQSAGKIGTKREPGGGKGTETERVTAAVAAFEAKIVPGAKLADGTAILDANEKITPAAWKALIKGAPEYGMTRAKFIEEFGYLIPDRNISDYGLTVPEADIVLGK